jgi:serine/threonine protein kinase/Tol biopolymer transport system component
MVGRSLGHYQIVEKLGEGGMGEVYRATDTSLKRQVAIKVLPEALAADGEGLARFQREAEVLASLNHPNIAAIYGLERSGGQLALVMELVEGPTLADRIAQGVLPLDDTLLISRQMAEALEAAHDKGIVHRDLKPANVKVRADGTVKLLDFGLAKLGAAGATGATGAVRSSDAEQATITSPALMTRAGLILGTAAYMSPEQARGKPADARSDIWSFGVVLVEMVTGRRPFEGETISDIIAAILTREPDLDGVPPALRRLVASCLAKSPRDRLRHIGDALMLVDRSPVPAPTTRRPVSKWTWAAAMLALLALTLTVAWLALRPRVTDEAVTRFYIDAPPGSAFNYTYSATAVAPDARQIVFRVATTTEGPALWLRPLDSLEGRRLAGTEGADFPFWSPDGRSIAFFAAGKLKRVDVSGSSPIVLCDASDADSSATEGSWNRDGVIIFGSPNGLYRVNASGGIPTLLSPVDAAAGETGYGSPQFLPDGDRFVVFARSEDASRRGYYVSSLSNPQQKNLLFPSGRKAVFVMNEDTDAGYVLYLQDRTLLARRIDRRTLALRGDPVPMASNVALFPPGFQASFWASPSGSLLVYRSEASDKPRLTWIHPDGKRQSETGTDDFYTNLRVSPDGARAVVELADDADNSDIWMWDFARRAKLRLTFEPRSDRAATWAPNGREIAFSSVRSGNWQLFRKDVTSGQPEEPLTTGPADKILPDWSRDGRFIVFIQIGETTTEDIWALPLEGDRQPFPILQSSAIETNPAPSPDGRWLAYESSQSGRPEVYVTRFPDTRRVVDAGAPRWQVSTQGGSRPRWSGDGRTLYFVALDNLSIMRSAVRTLNVSFEYDAPRVHVEIPVMLVARSPYDATADGRLLVLERTINQAAPLAIVSNWTAALAGH